jgi:hypothetical protein
MGIATGACEAQYLRFKETEVKSLEVLYGCVSPADAATILISAVTAALSNDVNCERDSSLRCSLNWPRVMCLVRRFCDGRRWSDVEGSERPSLEAFMTSAIRLPISAVAPKSMTVIFALSRFLYRCGRNPDNADDLERGFRDYDRWFGRVVIGLPMGSVKAICCCLSEIVPLEPARYLRSSLRAFASLHATGNAIKDFMSLANVRLNELMGGTSIAAAHGAKHSVAATASTAAKAAADVSKFVAEFSSNGNRLPPSLVRLMNFHRYHFRSQFLEHLLSKDLIPSSQVLQKEFPRGGLVEFNHQRVLLLKSMAFDRKDRAISDAEARGAIAAIESLRFACSDVGASRQETSQIRILSKEDSIQEMVETIADTLSAVNCELMRKGDNDMRFEIDRISNLLATKLVSKQCDDDCDTVDVASSFLCAVLNCIGSRQIFSKIKADASKPGGPSELSFSIVKLLNAAPSSPELQEWVRQTLSWLQILLCDVVGDCRLARFRRALQSRMLILLCVQGEYLSQDQVLSSAMFVYALSSLATNETLRDLTTLLLESSFTRAQFVWDTIAEGLALKSSIQVLRSSQYSIFYARLVMSQPSQLSFDSGSKPSVTGEIKLQPASLLDSRSPDGDTRDRINNNNVTGDYVFSRCPDATEDVDASPVQCNYLPSALILLLRWLATSSWRLFAQEESKVAECTASNVRRDNSETSSEAMTRISVIGEAIKLLQMSSVSDVRLSIEQWTSYELRAGHGRVQEAADVMLRFVTSSFCMCHVFAVVAKTIANYYCRMNGCPATVDSVGSWLQLAFQVVARERDTETDCVSCRKEWVETSSTRSSDAYPFVQAFDECSIVSNEYPCRRFSRAYIDIVRHLPSDFYFGVAPAHVVQRHFSHSLVPILWPLSKGVTTTLVSAYLAWEQKLPIEDSWCDPPISLVVSSAMHWTAVERIDMVNRMLALSNVPEILRRARALSVVPTFQFIDAHRRRGMPIVAAESACEVELLSSQNVVDNRVVRNGLESVIRMYPIETGIALVLGSMEQVCNTITLRPASMFSGMQSFLGTIVSLQDECALQILDVAVDTSARFPLARGFLPNSQGHAGAASLSLDILVHVLEARVQVDQLSTDFLSDRDVFLSKTVARSCISTARHELMLGTFACSWPDALHVSIPDTYTHQHALNDLKMQKHDSYIHAFVNARIASAIPKMSKIGFENIRKSFGPSGWEEGLRRLLSVYVRFRRITTQNISGFEVLRDSILQAVPLLDNDVATAIERILTKCKHTQIDSGVDQELKSLNPALWKLVNVSLRPPSV